MPNLSVIVYRSRAAVPLTDVDLLYLLGYARDLNTQRGLTGVLLYDRGHFFQWLEGENVSLGRTWSAIRADPRHRDVRVLADQQIPARLFEGWSMQLARRERTYENVADALVVTDPVLLDDLHLNPAKVPGILASFSTLGGRFKTVDL